MTRKMRTAALAPCLIAMAAAAHAGDPLAPDIVEPRKASVRPLPRPARPLPEVSAIFLGERPTALIDGTVLGVGDRHGNLLVRGVSRHGVDVEFDGRRMTLSLLSPKTRAVFTMRKPLQ
ncbi:hypothetical protein [Sinimarinibacterium flocculans]|uniref:hypothetical protein n=1 Tax=Sinimarinibacterium flocculans TaxID=985250 RepID=UPI003515042C